ncbi:hypothetical protein [Halapricum hydrolyticum]|uniref:Uncharacterized protein n=1 Tax=Halapricum hydrolyticum TaxID=2979991 RepID=A0AAE3IB70_9EURY|nr:hypothetical protein [Halapricum hydrolyticum]MCU4717778.1 hypothetical protein [Halapricum hydrolyticum]MCU4726942.1 hypothetical protein [Halapricum hydrolyticum]
MNSIPSSKGTAALVALLIAAAAVVGTAAAVEASDISAPDEAQVGEEVTVEVTITELYEPDSDWTLRGATQLENVTGWQVTQTYPNGTAVEESYEGESEFELEVSDSDNFESITVSITGDAPAVETFSYQPPQSFEAAELIKMIGDGESAIETAEVHHYTEESRNARQTIESAEAAVNDADSADAESDLQNAIDWFNEGEFDRAVSNAEDAEQTAKNASQSQDTMRLLLYGVGVLVLIALIGGGIYYYRSQRDDYDKLR